jgi:hypothetical protein
LTLRATTAASIGKAPTSIPWRQTFLAGCSRQSSILRITPRPASLQIAERVTHQHRLALQTECPESVDTLFLPLGNHSVWQAIEPALTQTQSSWRELNDFSYLNSAGDIVKLSNVRWVNVGDLDR